MPSRYTSSTGVGLSGWVLITYSTLCYYRDPQVLFMHSDTLFITTGWTSHLPGSGHFRVLPPSGPSGQCHRATQPDASSSSSRNIPAIVATTPNLTELCLGDPSPTCPPYVLHKCIPPPQLKPSMCQLEQLNVGRIPPSRGIGWAVGMPSSQNLPDLKSIKTYRLPLEGSGWDDVVMVIRVHRDVRGLFSGIHDEFTLVRRPDTKSVWMRPGTRQVHVVPFHRNNFCFQVNRRPGSNSSHPRS